MKSGDQRSIQTELQARFYILDDLLDSVIFLRYAFLRYASSLRAGCGAHDKNMIEGDDSSSSAVA